MIDVTYGEVKVEIKKVERVVVCKVHIHVLGQVSLRKS